MENGPFIDYLPTKMVILQSYVKLLEGKLDGGCKLDVCLHGINQNDGYSIKMGGLWIPSKMGLQLDVHEEKWEEMGIYQHCCCEQKGARLLIDTKPVYTKLV
jgi:hypothetical protein